MIADLFTRASPENPTTSLSNPAAWLYSAMSGGSSTSYTGRNVSETSALNYISYLACVKVISETIAVLPLKLYRRLENGGREVAESHPVYVLLHDRPNPMMSAFTFRESMQAHLVCWGNAYAEIEYNAGGRPVALWPMLPDRTTIKLVRGVKILETRVGSSSVQLEPGEYLHIPGLGYDGLRGYSPISQMRHAVELGMATEEFGSRFFGRGGKPPAVIKHPGKLGDPAIARMRTQLETQHGTLSQSQRTMILDEGMDIKTIGIPNEDAQFLETRRFQVQEMARAHRIPPHKLMDLSRATFSNIEHSAIEFVQDCALPWARRWESELNRALLPERDRGIYFAEFLLDGLLRGDAKSRAETLAIQRQWGVLSVNEWRQLENLNPIDSGDEYIVPLNMAPPGQEGQSQAAPEDQRRAPPPAGREDRQKQNRSLRGRERHAVAYRRLINRAATHLVNREASVLTRLASKHLRNDEGVARLLNSLEEFYGPDGPFVEAGRRELLPVILSYAEAIRGEIHEETGSLPEMDVHLEAWADKYVTGYLGRHQTRSVGEVGEVLAAESNSPSTGGMVLAVGVLTAAWKETKAAKIAANEATRAGGLFAKQSYAMAGVTSIRWVAGGGCPLCQSMNGKVVALQEWFATEGQRIEAEDTAPLDVSTNVGHPPLHKGCDCMIAAG